MSKIVRRSIAVLAVAGGAVLICATPSSALDLNCSQFASQYDAQQSLKASWPLDPNNLDGDADGVACQSTSYSNTARDDVSLKTGDTGTPTGGVNTGFGGMADQLSPDGAQDHLPLVAGVTTALVGIGWTTTRRRRHA